MRIVHLFAGTAALAFALPAVAQTPGRTPLPAPTATPAPMPDATAPAQTMPGTPPATTTDVPPTAPGAPATAGSPAAATPAAAAPTTPVGPSVGATVYGSGGTPVGTIKDMNDQYVTLVTDKGEVKLPRAGVGPGLNGPVIGLTAEQLNAAVTQAQATQPAPAAATTTTKTTTKTKKSTR